MNRAAAVFRIFKPALGRLEWLSPRPSAPIARAMPSRGSARAAVWCFILAFLSLHAFAAVAMDQFWPRLRDPEYGVRVKHLKNRLAENPGRPLVIAIGSSRVSMGLSPAAWEASRPAAPGHRDPLLFNLSLVGSGPVMELMTLRRLYSDGFRPDLVVLEYWPPFLREDGPYYEPSRIDRTRLFPVDRELVRDYFDKPAEIERGMRIDRLLPFYRTRDRLLAQVAPKWQPWSRRFDMTWTNLDEWGWLPGIDEYPPIPERRKQRLAHCETLYRAQFNGYTIHPMADRAIRDCVALARANGAKVAFIYLPEASEFGSWVPPEVERTARQHLAATCRELDVPLINARHWLDDGYLVDGFHLSRDGAVEFTRRFGPAVKATFPDLGSRP
jgi:hypothetical protein